MRKNIYGIMAAVCLSSVLAAGCGEKNQAETLPAQSSETMSVQVSETVAATEETAEQQSVGTEGMTPVLASELRDGVYQIQVDSSSSMFRIEACELTVNDGSMTADMKLRMGAIISRFRWKHWIRNWTAPHSARRKKNGMTVFWYFGRILFRLMR